MQRARAPVSSYYAEAPEPEEVREPQQREIRCNVCKGSGLVEVFDQETDCIECEGYGTVLIDVPIAVANPKRVRA
jgi:RecJ-like exonuclease